MDASCAPITDPKDRILQRARAYVDWAVEHPDAYYVLFSQPRKAVDSNGQDIGGSGSRAMLNDLAEVHGTHPEDPSLLPLMFANWAAVHGLASLSIAVPFFSEGVRETTLRLIADSLDQHGPAHISEPLPGKPVHSHVPLMADALAKAS